MIPIEKALDARVEVLPYEVISTMMSRAKAFAKSRWSAEVDADLCTGCGICEDNRCPMSAVKVLEGVASVDTNRCISCGLCATTWEAEAIRMVPRVHAAESPRTASEMGIKVATEKGRIDDFLKLMIR